MRVYKLMEDVEALLALVGGRGRALAKCLHGVYSGLLTEDRAGPK
jgi:hypothetical protein